MRKTQATRKGLLDIHTSTSAGSGEDKGVYAE